MLCSNFGETSWKMFYIDLKFFGFFAKTHKTTKTSKKGFPLPKVMKFHNISLLGPGKLMLFIGGLKTSWIAFWT